MSFGFFNKSPRKYAGDLIRYIISRSWFLAVLSGDKVIDVPGLYDSARLQPRWYRRSGLQLTSQLFPRCLCTCTLQQEQIYH